MDEKRIGEIVQKVYEEAMKKCVSTAPSALAHHVEDKLFKSYREKISYKTVERAFQKHIDGKDISNRNAVSIDLLCKYLGYENYTDYITQNPRQSKDKHGEIEDKPIEKKKSEGGEHTDRLLVEGIILLLIIGVMLFLVLSSGNGISERADNDSVTQCMAWADSLYVKVPCDSGPYSQYGTKVDPLDAMKLKNFKKVEVTMVTPFFTEEGHQPLIWYYKNKEGEIEYYTAPGLHPVTGKTLDEITEYIIQKYVPLHIDRKDSFLQYNDSIIP